MRPRGQLKQLQALHEKYSEQGLIVVAVPSNDFAGQEPGNVEEILERYTEVGVTFAIADRRRTSVAPTWNFDKFLVDHRGDMRAVFPNDTEPLVKEELEEEYDYEEGDSESEEERDEEDKDDEDEDRRCK
ncbi:Thioredoxin-like fold [Phytophthora cactorum]|nr:Thioredoxin-like fold [Phytophthora cactorum]